MSEGWTQGNQLEFGGRTRTYAVYTPPEGEVRGMVMALHGSGESVEYMVSELGAESTADENGLVVVAPSGVDYAWNDEDPPGDGLADDVGFIDALVTEIQTLHPSIPDNQVFAHGFSNGGGLATRLACESRQIRGVGVVGNYYMSFGDACPRPSGGVVPGWFGAGLEDELVRVESVREGLSDYVVDLTDCPATGSLQPIEVADLSNGVVCKQLSGCDLARMCEYDDRGHEMLPGSFTAAWRFLNAAVE